MQASTFAQQADFSGDWRINTKLSQGLFERIYAAMGTEQLTEIPVQFRIVHDRVEKD